MAEGHSLYQSTHRQSGLGVGPVISRPALLPFEKQLIKTLGISEDEYRAFVAEIQRRGAVRPAEYALIPDIQAGPAFIAALPTIALNIGIAVVGAGISYLLTPKPKAPKGPDPVTRLELESIRGGNRFVASSGFDTTAELADYGQPIPVIFGMYLEGQTEEQSVGGIMVAPKLVWSRMSSQGRQQTAKLMFVEGEQGRVYTDTQDGIYRPDEEGIFLGNNALTLTQKENYVVYWKSNTTRSQTTRIRVGNAIHGDVSGIGTLGKADPNNNKSASQDDVFQCPLHNKNFDEQAFSYAYTPVNNTEFGLFEPIPNGSAYRVNFQIIAIPGLEGEGKPDNGKRLRLQREKIAGLVKPLTKYRKGSDDEEVSMMRGAGRNYSRRMGVITYDGNKSAFAFTQGVDGVTVGKEIEFKIADQMIPENFYSGVDGNVVAVGDINQEIRSQQIRADDALRHGEIFSIGSTIWQVTNRTRTNFLSEGKKGKSKTDESQIITLKCIDTSLSRVRRIGIVEEESVIAPEGFMRDGNAVGGEVGVRADFFPLTRIAVATIKNNRPAEIVEIGIASTVFQRLNGLCNFQDLITPERLNDYDRDNVAVSSGTINKYIKRTSLFQIYVRLVGKETFELLDVLFAVTGDSPVTMYNQIRITQPLVDGQAAQYEYKIVPRGSGDMRSFDDNQEVFRLGSGVLTSAKKRIKATRSAITGSYGTFSLQAEGKAVTKKEILHNPEFFRNFEDLSDKREGISEDSRPDIVEVESFIPDTSRSHFYATSANKTDKYNFAQTTTGNDAVGGMHGAFCYEAFGSADARTDLNEGDHDFFERYENVGSDRWILLEYKAVKIEVGSNLYVRNNIDVETNSPVQYAWWIESVKVVHSSGGFGDGKRRFDVVRGKFATGTNLEPDKIGGVLGTQPQNVTTPFNVTPGTQGFNPFAYGNPGGNLISAGVKFKVKNREKTSQEQGRFQGFLQEVLGNAQSRKVGNIFTETVEGSKGGKSIVLEISARVFEPTNDLWHGRTKLYDNVKYKVKRSGTTKGEWEVNDTFEIERLISYDNVFVRHFFGENVGFKFSVESIDDKEIVVEPKFDVKFEQHSQINEVSYYGSLVTRSCDDGPEHRITYVNEISRNNGVALYDKLTTAGLVLKANRNFSRLDQLRVWLEAGIPVRRLHPDGQAAYGDNKGVEGPSNLFTDLIYYLLTDHTAGVGGTLRMTADDPSLIDVPSLASTSKFLKRNQLFYNGALSSKINVREFIASTASAFLCNFIIKDGKFGLAPALPTNSDGEISVEAVQIKMYFNAGNILENTFQLEYLSAEERRPFQAVVRYRKERENKLPEEQTVSVMLADSKEEEANLPIETFDLTQFCTSHRHAAMAGMYFVGLRTMVGHTVQFSTTASGLNLAPGDYIKVETEASPYDPALTGTVDGSGNITSATEIPDGTYTISYFSQSEPEVTNEARNVRISNQKIDDPALYNVLFTIKQTTNSANVYIVEQLTFNEDMTVQVSASEFRCNDSDESELAILIKPKDSGLSNNNFSIVPDLGLLPTLNRRA